MCCITSNQLPTFLSLSRFNSELNTIYCVCDLELETRFQISGGAPYPLPRALWFGSKWSIQTDDLPMNNPLSLIEFIISPLSSPHFGLGIFLVLHENRGSPQTSRLAQNPSRFAQFHLNMTKPTNPRTNPKIEQI